MGWLALIHGSQVARTSLCHINAVQVLSAHTAAVLIFKLQRFSEDLVVSLTCQWQIPVVKRPFSPAEQLDQRLKLFGVGSQTVLIVIAFAPVIAVLLLPLLRLPPLRTDLRDPVVNIG